MAGMDNLAARYFLAGGGVHSGGWLVGGADGFCCRVVKFLCVLPHFPPQVAWIPLRLAGFRIGLILNPSCQWFLYRFVGRDAIDLGFRLADMAGGCEFFGRAVFVAGLSKHHAPESGNPRGTSRDTDGANLAHRQPAYP